MSDIYKTYSFENLEAWKESRVLVKVIYNCTQGFPDDERFGLTSQMRRAAVSVSSNIAEGSGRLTAPDQKNFYKNAYGSLMEVLSQVVLSSDLVYLSVDQVIEVRRQIDKVASRLTGLSNSRS